MRLALLSDDGEVLLSWVIEDEWGDITRPYPQKDMALTIAKAYLAKKTHRVYTSEEWESGTPVCHYCGEIAIGSLGEQGPAVCEEHARRKE